MTGVMRVRCKQSAFFNQSPLTSKSQNVAIEDGSLLGTLPSLRHKVGPNCCVSGEICRTVWVRSGKGLRGTILSATDLLHQLVSDGLQRQHNLHGRAPLPRVAVPALNDVLRCQVQVSVLSVVSPCADSADLCADDGTLMQVSKLHTSILHDSCGSSCISAQRFVSNTRAISHWQLLVDAMCKPAPGKHG